MRRKATINDVANLARVSIKTVSRVLNDEPNVRPLTRARVVEAIARLNYRPSRSARSLAGHRSFLIALLYDNPSTSYVIGIQSGVLAACRDADYQLLIHPCHYQRAGLAEEIVGLARQSHLEGVVLTPPLSEQNGLAAALDAAGIDHVRIAPGRPLAPGRGVYTNDRAICKRMVEYLVSLGHRRIGFVIGHPDHAAVAQRFEGYRDGLEAAGLRLEPALVAQGMNSFESGIECGRRLLAVRPRPTAIFASNDDMAAGTMAVAHELGLDLPAELSIAGFDDIPLARQLWPPLTTIRQPIAELGRRAGDTLLGRLRSRSAADAASEVIESELVLRSSTAAAPHARRNGPVRAGSSAAGRRNPRQAEHEPDQIA